MDSSATSPILRPMKRLTDAKVFSGLTTAWRLAICCFFSVLYRLRKKRGRKEKKVRTQVFFSSFRRGRLPRRWSCCRRPEVFQTRQVLVPFAGFDASSFRSMEMAFLRSRVLRWEQPGSAGEGRGPRGEGEGGTATERERERRSRLRRRATDVFSFGDGFTPNAGFGFSSLVKSRGTLPAFALLDAIAIADDPLCAIDSVQRGAERVSDSGIKNNKKKTHRPDEPVARLGPGHHRRGGARALGVGHDDGLAALHGGDGRVGGAQVDADDLLVRKGRRFEREFFLVFGCRVSES